MTRRLPVELMRTLDEKFVADWATFQTMRPTAAIVLDGAPLRTAEGALDRDAVFGLVRHLVASWPALRMRVRPMPLGVTTPAWVAAEPELEWHVRFVEECPPDEVDETLSGSANGPLALDRPLWTMLVVGLPDGDVAFVPQVQHALGDGIFALRFLEHLTADDPFDPADTAPPEELVSPRSSAAILVGAFRAWRAEQDGWGGAWREYTRKPFGRRLRRMGGRLLRPGRMRRDRDQALPVRRHRFATLELREVKLAAREAGCTLHDLVVASALVAADAVVASSEGVGLLVPLSRRVGTTGEERNNISMTHVEIPHDATRARAAAAVADRVAAFAAGEDGAPILLAPPGYVSYLPWRVRPRFAGSARVKTVVLWPVLDPRHRFGMFGSSYAGTFSVAVSGSESAEVTALRDGLIAALRAPAGSDLAEVAGVTG